MFTMRTRRTAALAMVVATAVLAPAASAHDSGSRPGRPLARKAALSFPFHRLDTQYCRYGQIWINTPGQVVSNTGRNEFVYFKTDVYRWTSSGWSFVTGTPYARAVAGPNGLINTSIFTSPWSWRQNGRYTNNFPGAYKISLPSGTYLTLQMIWWSSLTYPSAEKPPFILNTFTGSKYCSI